MPLDIQNRKGYFATAPYHGLGRLYSQAGQVEQAYTELSMAIQMYRDMKMMFWLPKAEATLTAI
jgi:hypothetical protein